MSGTAVWCGAVDLAYRIRRPLTPRVWTCVGALAAAAAVGILPLALGNLVWDEGFRRGDSQFVLAGFLSRTSTSS